MKFGVMLSDVIRSLFKKPVTRQYPFEKTAAPERLRGKLYWEPSRCTGCMLCCKDCPSNALELTTIDRAAKQDCCCCGAMIGTARPVDVCRATEFRDDRNNRVGPRRSESITQRNQSCVESSQAVGKRSRRVALVLMRIPSTGLDYRYPWPAVCRQETGRCQHHVFDLLRVPRPAPHPVHVALVLGNLL